MLSAGQSCTTSNINVFVERSITIHMTGCGHTQHAISKAVSFSDVMHFSVWWRSAIHFTWLWGTWCDGSMGLVALLAVLNHLPLHPVKFQAWWTCCGSEIFCFLRCKFIYIHLYHCTIKTSKWPWTLNGQRYRSKVQGLTFRATPDFQISLRFSLRTPVFELQAILRHQMCTKWPKMTLNTKRTNAPV